MKKILIGLLSFVLGFGVLIDTAFAINDVKLNASYELLRTHYGQNYKKLENVNEMLAAEALGLEVEDGSYQYPDLLALDYNDMSVKDISLNLIALVQIGVDPKDVNDVNLIEKIESAIQDDGSMIDPKYGSKLSAIYQYWCVYALFIVDSSYTTLAADGLAALQVKADNTIGVDNNIGGFGSEWGVTTDITGRCIEALSLVDKERYKDTLSLSIDYLARKQNADGGWISDSWIKNTNSDTMSCVINGLLAYDREGLLNGRYNKDGINPLDTFLTFQGSDGRFRNSSLSDLNDYSTFEAGIALGSYYHGSFILNAREKYKALQVKEEQKEETVVTPVVDNKNDAPITGDSTSVNGWLFMLVLSFGFIIGYGKLNEEYYK